MLKRSSKTASSGKKKEGKKISSAQAIPLWVPGYYDGSRHFVFFDSLLNESDAPKLREQWFKAGAYFSKPFKEKDETALTTFNQLENSLDFLYNAMLIERSKELSYVNSFCAQHNLPSIPVPTSLSGWMEVYKTIQLIQTGSDTFIKRLEEEQKRILANREYIKKVESQRESMSKTEYERALRGYEHGGTSAMSRATESRINNIITGAMRKDNFSTEVSEYIMKTYSQQIYNYVVNGGNPNVILAGVQLLVDNLIYADLRKTLTGKNGIFDAKSTKAERQKILEKTLQENNLTAQLDALMSSSSNLQQFEMAVISTMGLKKSPNKKQDQRRLASVTNMLKKSLQTNSSESSNETYSLDKIPMPKSSFCEISIQRGQATEIESALTSLVASAFHGRKVQASYGTGRSSFRATDIAQLVISTNNKAIEEYSNSLLSDFNSFMTISSYKFQGIGKGGRTAANAQQLTAMYDEYYNSLNEKLKEYRKLHDDAAEFFHIEETDKMYEAMGLNSTNEFEGAALGQNAEEVANRITMMFDGADSIARYQATGGLSAFDVNWLSNAILNCGEHMVARKFKGTVVNYLQTFAAFLMFDDFGSMAKQYIDAIANGGLRSDTVKTIHLYKLQRIYLPSSYILEQVYTHMKQSLQHIGQEITNTGHGVRVNISGNNYSYTKPIARYNTDGTLSNYEEIALTEKKWIEEADKAMTSTKIKMTFMGSFLDFINEFLNPENIKMS